MLAQLRSSLTYANVMATVAVFVALGGTSYAVATGSIDSREIKNNTVRSKDIRNNNVTTRDLRNNSVRGVDVRNESLTGDDILESSLGTVPSANSADRATSADTAAHASTASDASALGGLGPDAFLRSNRVTFRNPVSVNDAVGGPSTQTGLMTAGPVTILGECSDTGAIRQAIIRATASSAGTQISNLQATQGVVGHQSHALQVGEDPILLSAEGSTPRAANGAFSFHHPGSDTYRSATTFASVNSAGDCAFAITAFG